MPRLILMRHAKSSWAEPGLSDHDRPLNSRGRLAAPLMGAWLRDNAEKYGFDGPIRVIVSDALRTRETWSMVAQVWPVGDPVVFENRIYEAGVPSLLDVLREEPDYAGAVLMIGHNPGMQSLTSRLCGIAPPRFPTAAVAVIDCPDPWSGLAPGSCGLLAYEEPKALI